LSELEPGQQERLIASLVRRLAQWRLVGLAIVLLEANKPFSFLFSQALLFGQPFLSLFTDGETIGAYARLLEDRRNVERLIQRLEEVGRRASERREEEHFGGDTH